MLSKRGYEANYCQHHRGTEIGFRRDSQAPGMEEREAGRQKIVPEALEVGANLGCKSQDSQSCTSWLLRAGDCPSAFLTLLLAFSLLINMSWGWRAGKTRNN